MNTEQRLRDALESRATTATPSPGAFAEIRRRSDRRRWTTRFEVAAAAVAVAGVTAGAFALTGDRQTARPVPPATDQTPSPAPAPSASSSASASASPSAATAVGPVAADEFVALLRDGRLAVVSASSGAISRTVLSGLAVPGTAPNPFEDSVDVALAPDRRSVFVVTARETPECLGGGSIERVDLVTGVRTPVGQGGRPNVSPDGQRLVYTNRCAGERIVVRDLATGAEQKYDHPMSQLNAEGNPEPWTLREAVWHADGRRLWVVVDWEGSTELRLLDPATDRTTDDAGAVPSKHTTYGIERRGAQLVYLDGCCYESETTNPVQAVVLREENGTERELRSGPNTERFGLPEVGPDGDVLFQHRGRLFRLDPDGGAPKDLGASTALARDW